MSYTIHSTCLPALNVQVITLPSQVLYKALGSVIFSTSVYNASINCVNFKTSSDSLILTSADDHRCTRLVIPHACSDDMEFNLRLSSCKALYKALKTDKRDVSISVSEFSFQADYGNSSFLGDLIDHQYPNYGVDNLIKMERPTQITVDRKALIKVLNKLNKYVNDEKFLIVDVDLKDDGAIFYAHNNTLIFSKMGVVKGPEVFFRINSLQVLQALKVMTSDVVDIYADKSLTPIMIRDEMLNFTHIITTIYVKD